MSSEEQITGLKTELLDNLKSATSPDFHRWAEQIIAKKVDISELFDLLYLDHPIPMRFTWLLGTLSDSDPQFCSQIIQYGLDHFDKINVNDMDRVLAKQCAVAEEIPEKLEGVVVDQLLQWLGSPNASISTRKYAQKALAKLTKKYPDLQPEVDAVVTNVETQNGLFDKLY